MVSSTENFHLNLGQSTAFHLNVAEDRMPKGLNRARYKRQNENAKMLKTRAKC